MLKITKKINAKCNIFIFLLIIKNDKNKKIPNIECRKAILSPEKITANIKIEIINKIKFCL